jgi:hypothetical protein
MAGVWQLMIADPSSLAGLIGGATMLAVGGWGCSGWKQSGQAELLKSKLQSNASEN